MLFMLKTCGKNCDLWTHIKCENISSKKYEDYSTWLNNYLLLVEIYELDLGLDLAAPGLRKLHKLKEEHVKFSPCLRTQVKLASQVSQYFHTY